MSTSETYSFLIENIKSVRDILSVDNFSNVYEANHFFDSIAYLKLPILSRAILSKRINSQHFYGQIESNWIFTNKNPLLDKNYIEISKSIFDEYFNNLARNESYRLNFLVDNKILENLEWTANFSKNEKMSTSLWFYEQSLNARTHFLFLGFNLNLYEEKEHAAVFWLLSKMQKMRCDALKKYLIKLSENGNSKNGSEILKKSLQNVLITCESQQAISSSTLLLLLLSKGDKLKFGFQTIFSNGKKRFEGRFKHVLKGLSAENDFDHFSNEIDLINKRQKENKEDFILKIGQEMVEIRRKMKSIEKNGFNNRWIGQILEVVEHNLDILKYFDGSKIDIAFENGVFLPKIEIEAILE
ncbi:hypothetical protein MHBO_000943 [Bonamia ostreae]|uniref:NAA35-like TPR repeats domain-containing protein n=2 Tax=Bonamia ostreae TaxID=126728 RepID=A0ABV2AI73_9EUKA